MFLHFDYLVACIWLNSVTQWLFNNLLKLKWHKKKRTKEWDEYFNWHKQVQNRRNWNRALENATPLRGRDYHAWRRGGNRLFGGFRWPLLYRWISLWTFHVHKNESDSKPLTMYFIGLLQLKVHFSDFSPTKTIWKREEAFEDFN